MEQKTTQRIIGIFVFVALVIIALPLFFNKNTSFTSKSVVENKTVPANASVATTESAASQASQPEELAANTTDNTQPAASPETPEGAPVQLSETDDKTCTQLANPMTMAENKPVDSSPALVAEPVQIQPSSPVTTASVSEQASPTVEPSKPAEPKVKPTKVSNQAAWVVQMGNFKNKDNARRLTDKLRAAGFKAFTHAVKSGSVRVYVGPEYKQASAAALSKQVAQQIKMQGIVVSYKPLEL